VPKNVVRAAAAMDVRGRVRVAPYAVAASRRCGCGGAAAGPGGRARGRTHTNDDVCSRARASRCCVLCTSSSTTTGPSIG
jgi:hypothetical protein